MIRTLLTLAGFLLVTISLLLLQPSRSPDSYTVDLPAISPPALTATAITRENVDLFRPVPRSEILVDPAIEPFARNPSETIMQTRITETAEVVPTLSNSKIEISDLTQNSNDTTVTLAMRSDEIMDMTTLISPQIPTDIAPRATVRKKTTDIEMREMTWGVLRSIDQATGKSASPGTPGSLLHTIIRRSLSEPTDPASSQAIYLQTLATEAGAPRAAFLKSGTGPSQTYRVQPGDTLQTISIKFYGDSTFFETIFAANSDQLKSPNDLRAGQTLNLPHL